MSLPRGFKENGETGELACQHRDVSCCGACAAEHVEVVEVFGQHFWIEDAADRELLASGAF